MPTLKAGYCALHIASIVGGGLGFWGMPMMGGSRSALPGREGKISSCSGAFDLEITGFLHDFGWQLVGRSSDEAGFSRYMLAGWDGIRDKTGVAGDR